MTIADTYTRSDSTSTINPASDGGTWTIDNTSTWGITSNQGYLVSNGSANSRARRDTGQIDTDLLWDIAGPSHSGNIYLWFAYDPAGDNGYAVRYSYSLNQVDILRRVGGSDTAVTATSGSLPGATVHVTYVHATGVINVFRNGVSWLTYTDGSPWAGAGNTWVGKSASVSGSTFTWDNFSAASSTPPAPTFHLPHILTRSRAVTRAAVI